MSCLRWIVVWAFLLPAGAEVPPADDTARLTPVAGAPGALGRSVPWQTDGDIAALVTLELPAPGILTVVVQASNGADLQLAIADGMGVSYPGGHFDQDAPGLPGGEYGALLLPAGRVTVVVDSWGDPAAGELQAAWLGAPQEAEGSAPASEAFLAAPAVEDGAAVSPTLPAKVLLSDRSVFYLPPRTTDGVVGLAFDPPPGGTLLLEVYGADRPWEQIFAYEQGPDTLDLTAAAGVGYFLVVEHWEDGPQTLTLTRRDPGVAAAPPPVQGVSSRGATRRAPRRAPR